MPPRPRRKSIDSSSESSESGPESSHKMKMSDTNDFGTHSPTGAPGVPQFPSPNHDGAAPEFPTRAPGFSSPPPYAPVQHPPPASGHRLPLTTTAAFPDEQRAGRPAFYDADGRSPIFIGSALFERSVHPCKIGPHLQSFVSVPYGGGEHVHNGRYDLLPFRPDLMEWVRTSHGSIPPGRRPVEGGYEEDGSRLYHAVGLVNGVNVPGKCGEHLYVSVFLHFSCSI